MIKDQRFSGWSDYYFCLTLSLLHIPMEKPKQRLFRVKHRSHSLPIRLSLFFASLAVKVKHLESRDILNVRLRIELKLFGGLLIARYTEKEDRGSLVENMYTSGLQKKDARQASFLFFIVDWFLERAAFHFTEPGATVAGSKSATAIAKQAEIIEFENERNFV